MVLQYTVGINLLGHICLIVHLNLLIIRHLGVYKYTYWTNYFNSNNYAECVTTQGNVILQTRDMAGVKINILKVFLTLYLKPITEAVL